jgi:hypothetical protein
MVEDGSGRLPTFGSESREAREARIHQVRLDMDTTDADVRPEPGNLLSINGLLICGPEGTPVTVTLSSETGRRTAQSTCGRGYSFDALAPGVYEVFAVTAKSNDSAFAEVLAGSGANLQFAPPAPVEIELRRGGARASAAGMRFSLSGRRQDLSETENEQPIATRALLTPGRWEVKARVGPGQYVQSIVNPLAPPRRRRAPESHPDWYDVFIEHRGTSQILVSVSDQAAEIQGTAKEDGKTVAGVPVFLWPMDASTRRSLGGFRQVLSDTEGRFRFDGLPPGNYRLLASFDVSEVDEDVLEEARATTLEAKPSQTTAVDLLLWNAP